MDTKTVGESFGKIQNDIILTVIKQALESQIEDAVKVATENAKEELDRRIPEIVAGVSIKLMDRVRMERLQHELCIHIKYDAKNDAT